MNWSQLLETLHARGLSATGAADASSEQLKIDAIAYDSRAVTPGSLFVALRGLHADGAMFVRQAVERGAVAIIATSTFPGRS
jgi:UDP-N-acetylmuramyl pentapeptide synthase